MTVAIWWLLPEARPMATILSMRSRAASMVTASMGVPSITSRLRTAGLSLRKLTYGLLNYFVVADK